MRGLYAPLALGLVAALVGCVPPATTTPGRRPTATPTRPVERTIPERDLDPNQDVRLGGISLVGTWAAISVVDDDDATNDLERGVLEQTLLIRPRGTVVLTGVDQRASGTRQSFGGQITGNILTFQSLPGAARLTVQGRRLQLLDPRGRTTVYVLVGR
jgi:hypothetical protein